MEKAYFLPGAAAAIIGSIAIALTGCAQRPKSRFEGLAPREARAVAIRMATTRDEELREDLRQVFAQHRPSNVLVISGGDAHGAFGCGVLSGWRKSVASPRPQFDVVTGVSTGALMATFAFLGRDEDDSVLRSVYLDVRDRDIFQGPLSGPPDAVLDTAPLKRLIAQKVTGNVIRRVAAAHHQGRRLYVATVELDTGALCIWPMSKLAADAVLPDGRVDPAKLEKFRNILLASASIPLMFPPVEIDGGLHVDAGLRAALVLHEAMLGVDGEPGRTDVASSKPTVWVIFCGQLGVNPEPVGADVLHIGTRSLDVFTSAVEVLSIREVAYIAQSHDYQFRWTSEPAGAAAIHAVPGVGEPMFNPKKMKGYYVSGESIAANGAWHERPPPMDSLDEIRISDRLAAAQPR